MGFFILVLKFCIKSVANKYTPCISSILTNEYVKLGEYTTAIFPGNVHGVVVQISAYNCSLLLFKSIERVEGHNSSLTVTDLL